MPFLYGPNGQLIGSGLPDNGSLILGNSTGSSAGAVSLANNAKGIALNPRKFTACGWVFVNSTASPGGAFLTLGTGSVNITAGFDTSPAQLLLSTNLANAEMVIPTIPSWYFFALQGNAGTASLSFLAPNADPLTVTCTNTASTGSGTSLYIGNNANLNAGGYYPMCDVQWYSYVLSSKQLRTASLQRQPFSTFGLQSYVPLRNLGSCTHDAVTKRPWTRSVSTDSVSFRGAPPVPEVAQHSSFPLLMSEL